LSTLRIESIIRIVNTVNAVNVNRTAAQDHRIFSLRNHNLTWTLTLSEKNYIVNNYIYYIYILLL